MRRVPGAIERESYAILRSRVATAHLPPLTRAVVERVIHASADLDYASALVCQEDELWRGRAALGAGVPVVADARMVAAGITTRDAVCHVAAARTRRLAATAGITRSAAAVRVAYEEVGPGAVWVIGNAPTALFELIALGVAPALVVGLPVGFVGAAESKAELRRSGLPAVSNHGEKGGSAVAAAALNALLYAEPSTEGHPDSHSEPHNEGHAKAEAESRTEGYPDSHPEPCQEGHAKAEADSRTEPQAEESA
jgi:precorrin-8X/cobalt-precorrin-8 methylmutase